MSVQSYAYPPRLMCAAEAARYLGMSEKSLQRLVRQGHITPVEVLSMRRYDIAELDRWASSRPEAVVGA